MLETKAKHDTKNIQKKKSQVGFRMKIRKTIVANMSFTFFKIAICLSVLSLSSFRVHFIGT